MRRHGSVGPRAEDSGAIAQGTPLIDLHARYLEDFETYARALGHAHILHLVEPSPSDTVAELTRKLIVTRDGLIAEIEMLGRRQLMSSDFLCGIGPSQEPQKVVFAVSVLCFSLLQEWERIGGRTAVTLDDLAVAEQLSLQLSEQFVRMAHSIEPEASVMRRRAFTMFVRAYDQVRRAVGYLRWNDGDADEIAPPLGVLVAPKRRRGR